MSFSFYCILYFYLVNKQQKNLCRLLRCKDIYIEICVPVSKKQGVRKINDNCTVHYILRLEIYSVKIFNVFSGFFLGIKKKKNSCFKLCSFLLGLESHNSGGELTWISYVSQSLFSQFINWGQAIICIFCGKIKKNKYLKNMYLYAKVWWFL